MIQLLLTLSLISMPAMADEPTPEVPAAEPADTGESESAQGDTAVPPESEEGAAGETVEEVPEEPAAPEWPILYKGQITPDMEHAHWDLEMMYAHAEIDKGLAAARAGMAAHPEDKDYYWHASRFMFEVGEAVDKNDSSFDKEALYAEMREVAEKGLEVAPNDPHLLFARGIAMGRLGTTRGVLSSLFMANDIESDWLGAANSGVAYAAPGGDEVLPCDVFQALGIFYRLVPDSWIVKLLAGTKGDLEKSVAYTKQGDKCSNGKSIRNAKEYGVSQICYGQNYDDPASIAAGIVTLERMIKLTPGKATEFTDVKHGSMLIADPSLACEYSRDGQQDLDEEQLEK